jgi:hypothetical protein
MAWTPPGSPYFVVAEVVTAAKMNVLSDNLRYLKGTDGAVQIDNDLTASLSGGAALIAQGTANGSLARLSLIAKTVGGASVDYRYMANALGGGEWVVYDNVASAVRLWLTSGGNLGVGPLAGAAAPAGALHVRGAGGGMLFLSATAVGAAIQTLSAAGTVTVQAFVIGTIRNNGGSGVNFYTSFAGSTLFLGQTFTSSITTAADQLQIAVTAGGAITVQRVAGSNTFEVDLLVLYK